MIRITLQQGPLVDRRGGQSPEETLAVMENTSLIERIMGELHVQTAKGANGVTQ